MGTQYCLPVVGEGIAQRLAELCRCRRSCRHTPERAQLAAKVANLPASMRITSAGLPPANPWAEFLVHVGGDGHLDGAAGLLAPGVGRGLDGVGLSVAGGGDEHLQRTRQEQMPTRMRCSSRSCRTPADMSEDESRSHATAGGERGAADRGDGQCGEAAVSDQHFRFLRVYNGCDERPVRMERGGGVLGCGGGVAPANHGGESVAVSGPNAEEARVTSVGRNSAPASGRGPPSKPLAGRGRGEVVGDRGEGLRDRGQVEHLSAIPESSTSGDADVDTPAATPRSRAARSTPTAAGRRGAGNGPPRPT